MIRIVFIEYYLLQLLEDQRVLGKSLGDRFQTSQEFDGPAEQLFQPVFGDKEGKVGFICGRKDQHVSELSVSGPEDVCNDKTLAAEDTVKSHRALHRSSDTDFGGLHDLGILDLFLLRLTRGAHPAVLSLKRLGRERRRATLMVNAHVSMWRRILLEVHMVVKRMSEERAVDDILGTIVLRSESSGVDIRRRRVSIVPLQANWQELSPCLKPLVEVIAQCGATNSSLFV